MFKQEFIDQITAQIRSLMQNPPISDWENNLKAILQAGITKLNLVSREEFDIQQKVLADTRAKIAHLEQIVSELEAKFNNGHS